MKPVVSVLCITYNQENYIKKAIDSFLMQETDFPYEILIHDDASTDRTADIVKEYENKYPTKIKGIYQTENQYSKRKEAIVEFLFPIASGKYFAICEGDDYWTDKYKLQRQYSFMEEHQDVFLCAHSHTVVDGQSEKLQNTSSYSNKISFYNMEDAIKGFGREVATNSMFLKREVFEGFPKFAYEAPCGDYVWPILAAKKGKIAYLPYNMCVHRMNAKNSLSVAWKESFHQRTLYNKRYETMLNEIDVFTEQKYSDLLGIERVGLWFRTYYLAGNFRELRNKKYKIYLNTLSLKKKIIFGLHIYVPYFSTIKHFLLKRK